MLVTSLISFLQVQEKKFYWCETYIHKILQCVSLILWGAVRLHREGKPGIMESSMWSQSLWMMKTDILNLAYGHNLLIMFQNSSWVTPNAHLTNRKQYPYLIICLFVYGTKDTEKGPNCRRFCFADKMTSVESGHLPSPPLGEDSPPGALDNRRLLPWFSTFFITHNSLLPFSNSLLFLPLLGNAACVVVQWKWENYQHEQRQNGIWKKHCSTTYCCKIHRHYRKLSVPISPVDVNYQGILFLHVFQHVYLYSKKRAEYYF